MIRKTDNRPCQDHCSTPSPLVSYARLASCHFVAIVSGTIIRSTPSFRQPRSLSATIRTARWNRKIVVKERASIRARIRRGYFFIFAW
ncbi:hypothetical protein CEXT_591771 [Caerostris extrusa]|uniref:Uncharacterized protein n=1 Tax=Caerostris extrusa TaxID=172846 RepID=A0AAV4NTK6_CAEEX|nr:hypothetical protein CEXT_591771 [Caerostris extrusa]